MKNFLKLFGIIALVAVIGFTMVACGNGSTNVGGPSLNGLWERNDGGTLITVNGNSAVITQLSPQVSLLWASARNKGMLKVGDRIFRNLKKTDEFIWEGQELAFTTYSSEPNVAQAIDWYNTKITMNSNLQRFTVVTTRTGGGYTNSSYVKRQ